MLIKCKSMQKKHKLCSSVMNVFLLRTRELVCCFILMAQHEKKEDRTIAVGFILSGTLFSFYVQCYMSC